MVKRLIIPREHFSYERLKDKGTEREGGSRCWFTQMLMFPQRPLKISAKTLNGSLQAIKHWYRRVALRGHVQSNLCCLTAQQLHSVLYGGFLQHVASFLDVLWYAV